MMKPSMDISRELQALINTIAAAPGYHGRPTSPSIMRQIIMEIRDNGSGIIAPYWLSVLERGRAPRTSTVDSGLWRKIYAWMDKHNMFRSSTERGKINDAKAMTWWINKYGNKHFRSKQFIDVYTTAREQCIKQVEKKYGDFAYKTASDIL